MECGRLLPETVHSHTPGLEFAAHISVVAVLTFPFLLLSNPLLIRAMVEKPTPFQRPSNVSIAAFRTVHMAPGTMRPLRHSSRLDKYDTT